MSVRSRILEASRFHCKQRSDRLYLRTYFHALDTMLHRPRRKFDCSSDFTRGHALPQKLDDCDIGIVKAGVETDDRYRLDFREDYTPGGILG